MPQLSTRDTPPTPNRGFVRSVLRFIEFYENREDPENLRKLKSAFAKIAVTISLSSSSSSASTNDDVSRSRTEFPVKRNLDLIEQTRVEESVEKSIKFLKSVFYASKLEYGEDLAQLTWKLRSDYRFFLIKLLIDRYLHPDEGHFCSSDVSQFAAFVMNEIESLPSSDCVELILHSFGYCFQQGTSSSCKYWADVFGKLLGQVYQCVEAINIEKEGKFRGPSARERLVEKLCAFPWKSANDNVLRAIVAFQDIGLNEKELFCVISKVLSQLKELDFDDIPPVVYQVLTLADKENRSLFECSFAVALLLGLTQIPRLKDDVLQLVKSALKNFFKEKESREKCAWLKSCLPPSPDLQATIQSLTKGRCSEWEAVLQGIVELGFRLMDVHLSKVLVVAGHIFEREDKLNANQSACVLGRWLLEECFTDLLDHVGMMSCDVATPLMKCLLPIVKLCPSLRDQFLLTLKKAMFERETEPRKVAVVGFLLFMKHFEILSKKKSDSSATCSQLSQSFPTFSSQAYGSSQEPMGATQRKYESLCLEAIGCLRRCFAQKAEIRTLLYRGLVEVVRKNLELLDPVVELLYRQLEPYMELEEPEHLEDRKPALKMDKVLLAHKDEVELMEPLGELILALVQLVNLAKKREGKQALKFGTTFLQEDFDIENCAETGLEFNKTLLRKVKEGLYELATKFVEDKLEDYGLDKDADYSAEGSGLKNSQLASCCLGVYEGLFDAVWWAMDYEKQTSELMVNLYKKRAELAKVLKEKGIGAAGKKMAGNLKERKAGVSTRKETEGMCVQLETVVSLFEKVLTDKKPDHDEGLTVLREECDLLSWVYEVASAKVNCCMKSGDFEATNSKTRETLYRLGKLMICQFKEDETEVVPSMLCGEDDSSSLRPLRHAAVVLYGKVLECLTQMYPEHWLENLSKLKLSNEEEFDCLEQATFYHFQEYLSSARKVLDTVNPERKSTDGSMRAKEAQSLIQMVSVIVHLMPADSDQFNEAYERIVDTCKSRRFDDAHLAKSVWQILFHMQMQRPRTPKMLSGVAENLCTDDVMGLMRPSDQDLTAQEPSTVYSSLTKKSGPEIAKLMIGQITMWLENVEIMTEKLKKEVDALPKLKKGKKKQGEGTGSGLTEKDRMRQERERKLCQLTVVVINGLGELATVKLEGKVLEELMLKCISKAFKVLGALTDYYKLVCDKKSGDALGSFTKLAQAVGMNLSKKCAQLLDMFITGEKKEKGSAAYARNNQLMKLMNQYTKDRESYESKLMQLSQKTGNKVVVRGVHHSANLDFKWMVDELPEQPMTQENNDSDSSDSGGEVENTQGNDYSSQRRAQKRTASGEETEGMGVQRKRTHMYTSQKAEK